MPGMSPVETATKGSALWNPKMYTRKDKFIVVRNASGEKTLFEQAARARGIPLSKLIRDATKAAVAGGIELAVIRRSFNTFRRNANEIDAIAARIEKTNPMEAERLKVLSAETHTISDQVLRSVR
jgi:hypothetical protein